MEIQKYLLSFQNIAKKHTSQYSWLKMCYCFKPPKNSLRGINVFWVLHIELSVRIRCDLGSTIPLIPLLLSTFHSYQTHCKSVFYSVNHWRSKPISLYIYIYIYNIFIRAMIHIPTFLLTFLIQTHVSYDYLWVFITLVRGFNV